MKRIIETDLWGWHEFWELRFSKVVDNEYCEIFKRVFSVLEGSSVCPGFYYHAESHVMAIYYAKFKV